MGTKSLFAVVLSSLFCIYSFAQDVDFAPVRLRPVRATYTKVTIKWQPGSSATQAVSYKVFRDGNEVATSTEAQYTDSNLQSGTEYLYKVIAVSSAGENSPASAELKVKTIKSVQFQDSDKVEQIVDQLHDTLKTTSALSLITAFKSGFEALFNTNITFNTVDSEILEDFVNEELAVIQEVSPEMTDAERVAAQTELDGILNDSFGGNSFEHVYIHMKLTELGDKHYIKGNKVAAKTFYEFSLKYLNDQETYVYNSLARLARFKLDEITDESTPAEVEVILHAHRDINNRFFDFFENSTSQQALSARSVTAIEYFKKFPLLLTYGDYNQEVFSSAQQAAQAAKDMQPEDARVLKNFEKVDAWELVNQKYYFKDSNGNPVTGSMVVKNISIDSGKKYFFYGESAFTDEREFNIVNGEATVPCYKGHIYETDFSFDVEGGNPIKFTTTGVPALKGKTVTINNFGNPEIADGEEGVAKTNFVIDKPTAPYNLVSVPKIDVFTLKWDWVNSETFTASRFKVFRGPAEIADVTVQEASNIPLESPDGFSVYTVRAYDANGNASPQSRELLVLPGDQTPHADFFAWMQSHFGDQLMYSCDDPDGDGISNYQEFLDGTDPTRIPGPVPFLGQRTYTKITLKWDAFFTDTQGVTYKVYRGDTELGSSNTNSYTDTNLTPGLSFAYKVKAVKPDGTTTEIGIPASFATMKPEAGEYADKIQQVVDQFNPISASDYTGTSLVTAVKSAFEAVLGTNITFTVVNKDIVDDFVEEELNLIKEVAPTMTEAERLTAKTELNDSLENDFGGNSFEHVYMHSKLTELGDKHWNKGHKEAAKKLYECSLGYMKNMESYVSGSLSRLARFELEEINDDSTKEEILAALNKYRDTNLRFFNYFENSNSNFAIYAYRMPASEYYKKFPVLLKYDDYNQSVFNTASQLIQSACDTADDDSMLQRTSDRIKAWELMNVDVSVLKPDGSPAAGTIVIKNMSDKYFFGEDFQPEEREFRIDGSTVTIPMYVGHEYQISTSFDVTGGPSIQYTIDSLPHSKGKKSIYDPYNETVTQDLPEGEVKGELVFVTDQPQTPYNLRAAKLPDVFTLTWDWVAPNADYQLQCFKVYRGDELIGTVTEQQMENIPRILEANACYIYKVLAVDASNNQTAFSPTIKVLPEFTEEEQKYFTWKTKYFGDQAILANADPDNDGLTNWEEFQLGTNPTVAPTEDPKANLNNIQPGLNVKYFKGKYTRIPDFSQLTADKEEVLQDFCFSTSSNILNSGVADELAMTFDGYFDVSTSGKYTFYLTSNDCAKLFINGVEVIHNDRVHRTVEGRNTVTLNKGSNAIRIEYFDYSGSATLHLDWSGPDMARTDISPSVWFTDENDSIFAEVIAWQKDRDLDGIRDVLEKQYGTDFNKADSDGDGITDGDEVFKYQTDPTKADTDGDGVSDYEEIHMSHSDALTPDMFLDTLESVQTIKGSEYKLSLGNWRKVNGSFCHAEDRRGYVTYEIDLPKAYVYRLRLDVQEYYPVTRLANIQIFVDNAYVGKRLVNLNREEHKDVFFYLPWLTAGKHTVKVYWDNYLSCSSLKINELEVQKIEGPDADSNEIADWIEAGFNKICTVPEITSSKVSPVCLEGKTNYIDMLKVADVRPADGASGKWYKDIDLSTAAPTTVNCAFQNGGKVITRNITWAQTNIVQENGSTVTLRKGDSLLLNAHPAGAGEGQFTINIGDQNYTGAISSPQTVAFNNTGTFTVQGSFAGADNASANGSITVKVVEYSFHETEPACWVDRARSWDVPKHDEEVKLEFDDRFEYVEKSSVQLANDDRYNLTIDENKDRFVVARLGENGPILTNKRIKGFEVLSSNKTYVRQVEELEDGTKIYEMLVVNTPVKQDIELRLHIFVSGVLFDDGTIEKTITSSDFDATGQYIVRFLYPPETKTSVCHTLKAYQNNVYVGIRY